MKRKLLTSSQFPIARARSWSFQPTNYVAPPPTTAVPTTPSVRNQSLKLEIWKQQSQNQPIFYDLTSDNEEEQDKPHDDCVKSQNAATFNDADLSDFAEYDPSTRHQRNVDTSKTTRQDTTTFRSVSEAKAEIEKKRQNELKKQLVVEILDDDSDNESEDQQLLLLENVTSTSLGALQRQDTIKPTSCLDELQLNACSRFGDVELPRIQTTSQQTTHPDCVISASAVSDRLPPKLVDPTPANLQVSSAVTPSHLIHVHSDVGRVGAVGNNLAKEFDCGEAANVQQLSRATAAPSSIKVYNRLKPSMANCLTNWYLCRVNVDEEELGIHDDAKAKPIPLPESASFKNCIGEGQEDDNSKFKKKPEYCLVGWLRQFGPGKSSGTSNTSTRIVLRNLTYLSFEPNRESRGYWIAVAPDRNTDVIDSLDLDMAQEVTPLYDPIDDDTCSEGGTTISSCTDPFPPSGVYPRRRAVASLKRETRYWLQDSYQAQMETSQSSFLHWNHRVALSVMSFIFDECFASGDASLYSQMNIQDLVQNTKLGQYFKDVDSRDGKKEDIDLKLIAASKEVIVALMPGMHQFLSVNCPLIQSIKALPNPRKQMRKSLLPKIQYFEAHLMQHSWGGPINDQRASLQGFKVPKPNVLVKTSTKPKTSSKEKKRTCGNHTHKVTLLEKAPARANKIEVAKTTKPSDTAVRHDRTVSASKTAGARREKFKRQFESYRSNDRDEQDSSVDTPRSRNSAYNHSHKRQRVCKDPFAVTVEASILSKEQKYSTPKVTIPAYKLNPTKKVIIQTGSNSAAFAYSNKNMKQVLSDFRMTLNPVPCESDPANTWFDIQRKKFSFIDATLTKELFRKVAELEMGYWPFEAYLLLVEAMINTCQKGRYDIAQAFFFQWKGEVSPKRSAFVIFCSCIDFAIAVVDKLDRQRLFDELEASTALFFLKAALDLILKASVIDNKKQLETLTSTTVDLQESLEKIEKCSYYKMCEDCELRRFHKLAKDKLNQANMKLSPVKKTTALKDLISKIPKLPVARTYHSNAPVNDQQQYECIAARVPRKSVSSTKTGALQTELASVPKRSFLHRLCAAQSTITDNSLEYLGDETHANPGISSVTQCLPTHVLGGSSSRRRSTVSTVNFSTTNSSVAVEYSPQETPTNPAKPCLPTHVLGGASNRRRSTGSVVNFAYTDNSIAVEHSHQEPPTNSAVSSVKPCLPTHVLGGSSNRRRSTGTRVTFSTTRCVALEHVPQETPTNPAVFSAKPCLPTHVLGGSSNRRRSTGTSANFSTRDSRVAVEHSPQQIPTNLAVSSVKPCLPTHVLGGASNRRRSTGSVVNFASTDSSIAVGHSPQETPTNPAVFSAKPCLPTHVLGGSSNRRRSTGTSANFSTRDSCVAVEHSPRETPTNPSVKPCLPTHVLGGSSSRRRSMVSSVIFPSTNGSIAVNHSPQATSTNPAVSSVKPCLPTHVLGGSSSRRRSKVSSVTFSTSTTNSSLVVGYSPQETPTNPAAFSAKPCLPTCVLGGSSNNRRRQTCSKVLLGIAESQTQFVNSSNVNRIVEAEHAPREIHIDRATSSAKLCLPTLVLGGSSNSRRRRAGLIAKQCILEPEHSGECVDGCAPASVPMEVASRHTQGTSAVPILKSCLKKKVLDESSNINNMRSRWHATSNSSQTEAEPEANSVMDSTKDVAQPSLTNSATPASVKPCLPTLVLGRSSTTRRRGRQQDSSHASQIGSEHSGEKEVGNANSVTARDVSHEPHTMPAVQPVEQCLNPKLLDGSSNTTNTGSGEGRYLADHDAYQARPVLFSKCGSDITDSLLLEDIPQSVATAGPATTITGPSTKTCSESCTIREDSQESMLRESICVQEQARVFSPIDSLDATNIVASENASQQTQPSTFVPSLRSLATFAVGWFSESRGYKKAKVSTTSTGSGQDEIDVDSNKSICAPLPLLR